MSLFSVANIAGECGIDAGWDCVMIEDCCATTTPGASEVCAYNIGVSSFFVRPRFGFPWVSFFLSFPHPRSFF